MTQHPHPGPHLDADQLAAFAEGALSPRERQESMVHLAECAACREVAFFAQQGLSEPAPAQPAAQTGAPFWRSLLSWNYGLTALACLLLLAVSMWTWHTHSAAPPPTVAHTIAPTIAHTAPPPLPAGRPPASPSRVAAPAPSQAATPAPLPQAATPAPAPQTAQPSTVARAVLPTAPPAALHPRPGKPAPAQAAPAPPASAAFPMGAQGASTDATSEDAAARSAVQDLPVNGRNASALPSQAGVAPSASASAPAPSASAPAYARSAARNAASAPLAPALPPVDGALNLRIEHRAGDPAGLAQVSGDVLDATGAVIPGATATLRQGSGAPVRQAKTDPAGRFTIAHVPAGRYDLEITAQGFETVTRSLELQGSDLALLTSRLPVGAATQTVEVTAASPALQTDSVALSNDLPLLAANTAASVPQGKRILALDTAGTLHLSTNRGKRYKTVKPQWPGKVASIAATAGGGFQLTTDAGAVWLSADGLHWQPR